MPAHSTQKMDLTGQRYGRLAVLEAAENVGGRTAWKCGCDCGRTIVVQSHRLRSGHTASCGCWGKKSFPGEKLSCLTYVDGTCIEMLRAKTVRRNNTSGVPGVGWLAAKKSWRATICFKGKRHYLGSYKRFEDAVLARKEGEKKYHDCFVESFSAPSENSLLPESGREAL